MPTGQQRPYVLPPKEFLDMFPKKGEIGQVTTTDALLRELIGEVRAMRMEMVRQRWLPDDLAMLIREKLDGQ